MPSVWTIRNLFLQRERGARFSSLSYTRYFEVRHELCALAHLSPTLLSCMPSVSPPFAKTAEKNRAALRRPVCDLPRVGVVLICPLDRKNVVSPARRNYRLKLFFFSSSVERHLRVSNVRLACLCVRTNTFKTTAQGKTKKDAASYAGSRNGCRPLSLAGI